MRCIDPLDPSPRRPPRACPRLLLPGWLVPTQIGKVLPVLCSKSDLTSTAAVISAARSLSTSLLDSPRTPMMVAPSAPMAMMSGSGVDKGCSEGERATARGWTGGGGGVGLRAGKEKKNNNRRMWGLVPVRVNGVQQFTQRRPSRIQRRKVCAEIPSTGVGGQVQKRRGGRGSVLKWPHRRRP